MQNKLLSFGGIKFNSSRRELEDMAHKILWVAPRLNHYKVRQLNEFSSQVHGMKVLHGSTRESEGHKMPQRIDFHFNHIQVNCTKKNFGWNIAVYREILRELRHNDFKIVLMPMEKKHLLTILFLYVMKHLFKFRLASYNHHYRQRNSQTYRLHSFFDRKTVYLLIRLYDIVVYYTENGMHRSISEKMVDARRAFFVSNTIDVESIFRIVNGNDIMPENNILFIARIIPSKRVDILLEYFQEIKKRSKDSRLFIIGGGHGAEQYKNISEGIEDVCWLGGIVEEETIAKYMNISKIVFVPGASGLSIVHSFAYKKPYVTLNLERHGPEIDYLVDGKNGLILPFDDKENNISKIVRLLTDDAYYNRMSAAAYEMAKKLTLENWVISMRNALQV